jgi:hypothetical protein
MEAGTGLIQSTYGCTMNRERLRAGAIGTQIKLVTTALRGRSAEQSVGITLSLNIRASHGLMHWRHAQLHVPWLSSSGIYWQTSGDRTTKRIGVAGDAVDV